MTTPLTDTQREILEKTTPVYKATLVDENDDPIPLADISALTLTYKNRRSGAVINSRNGQNILNANNVTVHATTGLLTWSMRTADTAIQDSTLDVDTREEHVALFEWTLTNGSAGKFQTRFFIVQMDSVS